MFLESKKIALFLALIGLLVAMIHSSCRKEQFTTDPADILSFSTDTLRFDTVFTELGSATRILKIYNTHTQSIRISKIFLEQGSQSKFHINVDGLPGIVHENIEIAPNDSLYIFAEVTINPDLPPTASPFVLDENLVFETNGVAQKVVLEAWGQNAVYIPSRYYADSVVVYSCGGGEVVWNDPRPYVIYGVVAFEDCTLRIPAGARVHVHGGLTRFVEDDIVGYYNDGILIFTGNGKLIVEGTKENPVIFEGDRLEPEFDEEPGQWTGIWLQPGTKGHTIDNCIIRNSIIGIRVDSAADLNIKNTQIYNTTGSGIIGLHATIEAQNCLFYANNTHAIQLEYGGNYNFYYCTAAGYGTSGETLKLGNTLCRDEICEQYSINPLHAYFKNCIIMGSQDDEISFFDRENNPALFTYTLENCLVRVKDLTKPTAWPDFFEHCMPCLPVTASDTLFLSPQTNNYHLDTLGSKANGYAMPLPFIDKDIEAKLRDVTMPDAGCYELNL